MFRILLCSAPEDKNHHAAFAKQLAVHPSVVVDTFGSISAGSDIARAMFEKVTAANCILFLLSSDFAADDFNMELVRQVVKLRPELVESGWVVNVVIRAHLWDINPLLASLPTLRRGEVTSDDATRAQAVKELYKWLFSLGLRLEQGGH